MTWQHRLWVVSSAVWQQEVQGKGAVGMSAQCVLHYGLMCRTNWTNVTTGKYPGKWACCGKELDLVLLSPIQNKTVNIFIIYKYAISFALARKRLSGNNKQDFLHHRDRQRPEWDPPILTMFTAFWSRGHHWSPVAWEPRQECACFFAELWSLQVQFQNPYHPWKFPS